jgi:peptidyl-prolyl cis-trans isomerase D
VIKVESVSATPVESANVAEQQKSNYQSAKQAAMYRFAQVLKDAATIKDYRSKHF